ncbi:helix-turn-helix transcriptional regulator [Aeromonas enteropelogenes]|uniref:helix-turn-helix transcriptional regulator n=3 Tax=Aeromonadaceae TaxID=84642 RepID=UPI003B9F1A9F
MRTLSYGRQGGLIMKLLKLKDVIAMTSLSKASVYRQMNAGTFPLPIRIGPRSVSWILSEIEEWIESKKSLRG